MTPTMEIFRFIKALQILRKDDEQLPMQTACVFCTIAMQPGITSAEIADRVGVSQSSVSRNTAALGKWHRFGDPGLDLVEAHEDPRERRRKVHFLTPKGRSRIIEVLEQLTGEKVDGFNAPTYQEWMRGGAR